jgi:hypothetical protein
LLINDDARAEQRWLADRATLGGQVEALNDMVVRLQRRCEGSEADGRRLSDEAHGLRQANAMLNDRISLVMKRAAAASDNSKVRFNLLAFTV